MMTLNITTLESKSIEEFLPLYLGAETYAFRNYNFRVAFVHTLYILTYKMRESICSLLRIYTLTQILSSCYYVSLSKPLLVNILKPFSPKVSNQTKNGKQIYIILYNKCNRKNFLLI